MTDSDRAHELNAVRAHSLLGTVAAVKGALDTILTHHLDDSTRESLLLMARRRLDHLSDELWSLAAGVPEPEILLAASAGGAPEPGGEHHLSAFGP